MKSKMITVKVSDLKSAPWNPRKQFDQALVDDIASDLAAGKPLIQAPSVWKDGKHYIVIAGNTRLEAVRKAKLKEVSVVEWECTREEAMVMTFKENEQRADVYPIQQAMLVANIFGSGKTVEEIVKSTGLKKSSVYDYMSISRRVHPEIVKMAEEHPSSFSKADLMELTAYPKESQKLVVEEWRGQLDERDDGEWKPSLWKLRRLTSSLKGCKFAGPGSKCSTCPMNSANIGVLPGFEDDKEVDARCNDPSCYKDTQEKWKKSVEKRRLAKAVEKCKFGSRWLMPSEADQKKPTADKPCAYYAWDDDKLFVKYGPSRKAVLEARKAENDLERAEKKRQKEDKKAMLSIVEKFRAAIGLSNKASKRENNKKLLVFFARYLQKVVEDIDGYHCIADKICNDSYWWLSSYQVDAWIAAELAKTEGIELTDPEADFVKRTDAQCAERLKNPDTEVDDGDDEEPEDDGE